MIDDDTYIQKHKDAKAQLDYLNPRIEHYLNSRDEVIRKQAEEKILAKMPAFTAKQAKDLQAAMSDVLTRLREERASASMVDVRLAYLEGNMLELMQLHRLELDKKRKRRNKANEKD